MAWGLAALVVITASYTARLESCVKDDESYSKMYRWLREREYMLRGDSLDIRQDYAGSKEITVRNNQRIYVAMQPMDYRFHRKEVTTVIEYVENWAGRSNANHLKVCFRSKKRVIMITVIDRRDIMVEEDYLLSLDWKTKWEIYANVFKLVFRINRQGNFYGRRKAFKLCLLNGRSDYPIILDYMDIQAQDPRIYGIEEDNRGSKTAYMRFTNRATFDQDFLRKKFKEIVDYYEGICTAYEVGFGQPSNKIPCYAAVVFNRMLEEGQSPREIVNRLLEAIQGEDNEPSSSSS